MLYFLIILWEQLFQSAQSKYHVIQLPLENHLRGEKILKTPNIDCFPPLFLFSLCCYNVVMCFTKSVWAQLCMPLTEQCTQYQSLDIILYWGHGVGSAAGGA